MIRFRRLSCLVRIISIAGCMWAHAPGDAGAQAPQPGIPHGQSQLTFDTIPTAPADAAHSTDTVSGRGPVAPAGRQERADTTAKARVGSDTLAAGDTSDGAAAGAGDTAHASSDLTDTVSYTAARIAFDVEAQVLTLMGSARITYQNLVLTADTITYRIEDDLFTATGSPRLIDGPDTTVGRVLSYNVQTRRGKVDYASSHMQGAYFNAREIVKSEENTFYARHGDYTTCARIDSPHYFFYARDVKVLPDDKAVARPAVLNIGNAPVAALPYFIMPLDRSRSSGFLTPGFGGTPGHGAFLDNLGYYWAINDYVDAQVSARLDQFRDYTIRARSQYVQRYRLNGTVSARYAGKGDFMSRHNDWVIDYRHQHKLVPDNSLRISGRGELMGRRNFYKAHSDNTRELMKKEADASLSLNKQFKRINASAAATFTRHQNLTTGMVKQTEPSLSFRLPQRPLISPAHHDGPAGTTADEQRRAWYNDINYSYSARAKRMHENDPADAIEPRFTRHGATQHVGLRYNRDLFSHFRVSPYVNLDLYAMDAYKDTAASDTVFTVDTLRDTLGRIELYADTAFPGITVLDTLYDNEFARDDTSFVIIDSLRPDTSLRHPVHEELVTDYDYNAGIRLSTTLYGIFPVKLFTFAGLRHVISPSLDFRYTPAHAQDKQFYAIGISPPGPRKRPRKRLSFTLDNAFDGKTVTTTPEQQSPRENKFRIITANLGISYDFEAPVRKFSNLSLDGKTSNAFANINYRTSFWMYDEHDRLSHPLLKDVRINVSPRLDFDAAGAVWGGDLRVLQGCTPDDPVRFRDAGPQRWSIGFSPNLTLSMERQSPVEPFVRSHTYQLRLSSHLNFTRDWRVQWNGHYDFNNNRLSSGNLSFYFDLECWEMRFRWRPPTGINPGYYFLIQIKEIPEIKWEKRD